MLSKTITWVDYDDVERTETFYFNLTESEIAKLEMSIAGGMEAYIRKIISDHDVPAIIKLFEELILHSYGVKSPDGRRFVKNAEVTRDFTETEAYSILFMELSTDADAAAAFVNGIIPKKREQKK